jgi:hypothetical protein
MPVQGEHLEGHASVMVQVPGEVDDSHAPAPELARVSVAQGLRKRGGSHGHAGHSSEGG